MEYFDIETENIKYIDTLSGRFFYRSKRFLLFILLFVSGGALLTARYSLSAPHFIILGILLMLTMLAMHVPCSYDADEDGFSIMSGFVLRHFSYSEVVSVMVENRVCGHTRGGGEIYENVLTVSTEGGTYRFHENCGIVRRRSLRYEPYSDQITNRHNELIRLKEFISRKIR